MKIKELNKLLNVMCEIFNYVQKYEAIFKKIQEQLWLIIKEQDLIGERIVN